MYQVLLKTHYVVVSLFFLIYLIKTVLLLLNKNEPLAKLSKAVKVPEMIISFLFLATGIYLMTQVEIKPLLTIKVTIVLLSIPLAIIGFKKANKALALISFLLITAAFGMGEMLKKTKVVVSEKAVNADGSINGQELYTANCSTCHGNDGKLKMAGAFDLSLTQLSNDSMAAIMLQGRNTMSPIAGLSAEQAQAVAQYVSQNIKGK
ncbi:MAG: c-type cytochrome [Bacteroidetes bacterium]|nr:c-type cytochrome [Bacteroidota bacterium]